MELAFSVVCGGASSPGKLHTYILHWPSLNSSFPLLVVWHYPGRQATRYVLNFDKNSQSAQTRLGFVVNTWSGDHVFPPGQPWRSIEYGARAKVINRQRNALISVGIMTVPF